MLAMNAILEEGDSLSAIQCDSVAILIPWWLLE